MLREKSFQLTIVLLKADVCDIDQAIREPLAPTVQSINIDPATGIIGRVLINSLQRRQPRWIDLLQEAVGENILNVDCKHSSALVILSVPHASGNRFMAISFGHGYSMLLPETIEDHFGLRTALNIIGDSTENNRLRSIETRSITEYPMMDRQSATRLSTISTFDFDKIMEMVTKVSGIPNDTDFARSVSGGSSLSLKKAVHFRDIPELCMQLLDHYSSLDYQRHFSWIDNLSVVKDKVKISQLNALLIEAIRSHTLEGLLLAIPEPLDLDEVEGFSYSTERSPYSLRNDLDTEEFMETVATSAIEIEQLRKSYYVRIHHQNGSETIRSVFGCIVWHVEIEADSVYTLFGGTWHRVAKSFVDEVDRYVESIPTSELVLPTPQSNESEDSFNPRCAVASDSILCMHKNLFRNTYHSPIEVCDLLTTNRQFVHIKRSGASSSLSHLYSQAIASCDLFLRDMAYRQFIREKVQESSLNVTPEFLAPIDAPNPSNHKIVLAVISRASHCWPVDFPFLTKMILKHACDEMRPFQVEVLHIIASG